MAVPDLQDIGGHYVLGSGGWGGQAGGGRRGRQGGGGLWSHVLSLYYIPSNPVCTQLRWMTREQCVPSLSHDKLRLVP